MKWFAISGSWRITNRTVRKDVMEVVKKILAQGNGIVTGGALGVDYFAAETVLKFGNPKKQLKVVLPIKLNKFIEHFKKRVKEKVIIRKQFKEITSQWLEIKKASPESILDETNFQEANEESYFARNQTIINLCNELYAFQVNESKGVQDAINKAKAQGKIVHLKKYEIKQEKAL